jgi:hypothetical protein
LLFEHSVFNGHPRFYAYITSSAAPIGMLADLLAAAVNANVGAWKLAPIATEIEVQVIRWLAQFIGYPADCGGLLLSGGNMANLTCFLAARATQAGWDVRSKGTAGGPRLCISASTETHTWIQKAADLAGLGTDAVHWIDGPRAMDLAELQARYNRDSDEGYHPFLVVGSSGANDKKQERRILALHPKDIPPKTQAEIAEARRLLHLNPDATEFELTSTPLPSSDTEFAVQTRSISESLQIMAAQVEVPPEDVSQHKAFPGFEAGDTSLRAIASFGSEARNRN